jgi:hypothetical protein
VFAWIINVLALLLHGTAPQERKHTSSLRHPLSAMELRWGT